MMNFIMQYGLAIFILILLAVPLGKYIGKIIDGESVFLTRVLTPFENFIYKFAGIKETENMSWKKYGVSVALFSIFGFIILFALHMLQGVLPLNPQGLSGTSWHLAFNNASSFITNTNWQSYSGEDALSYLTQTLGLTVQNFLSAAAGISVLFVLIRGFNSNKYKGLGNFWKDVTKVTLYILLPLSLVLSGLLVSQGVVQSLDGYEKVSIVEPIELEDGTLVTEEIIPLGAAASQIAIKQLGTNGGGVMGTNSAHPLENPNSITNLLEMLSLILIPAALCFTFGRNVGDKRQGIAIFIAMLIMLTLAFTVVATNEQNATPQLAQQGLIDISNSQQAGGNMEGKESRFGIAGSTMWATFTTAASNGSVNSMHDSYTPLGGMVLMILMQLGEVVFGGTGSGLYGMLAFVILTIFIAGLMVGRTPEYLGKKIEPFEMKMSVIACLAPPFTMLLGSGIAVLIPSITSSLTNGGIHGFSEILYAFTSAGANNGSAFAGLNANTVFLNTSLGLIMLLARFIPMMATLAMAESLFKKKTILANSGTLPTHNSMFIGLLIFVILLIGALSFFPALALGPIAEFFEMIG